MLMNFPGKLFIICKLEDELQFGLNQFYYNYSYRFLSFIDHSIQGVFEHKNIIHKYMCQVQSSLRNRLPKDKYSMFLCYTYFYNRIDKYNHRKLHQFEQILSKSKKIMQFLENSIEQVGEQICQQSNSDFRLR